MSIIRIIHAVPKMNREGIQSFLMNIYRNIDRNRVQFDFLIHSKERGDFESEIEELGGNIYHLYSLSSHHFLHYQRDLKTFFRQHQYRIIHSHINLLSSFTLKGAMKAGINVRIAHSHSSSILDRGFKRLIKLFARKKMNKYATKRFACSKDAAIWQFGKVAFNAGEVEIIPNGIDVNKFLFSNEKRDEIRKAYNIEKNAFVIGHVGGFREVKNHIFLLKVFASFKNFYNNFYEESCARCYLMLVGSGELEKKIKDEARYLGILDSIIFTGSVKETACYYSAFDSFVFPSIYEGLGIVLVEGQAAGLPCFLSDTLPIETKLREQYYPLSLCSSPDEWAHFILEHSHQEDRKCPKNVWQYDIKSTAKRLEEFYIRLALAFR